MIKRILLLRGATETLEAITLMMQDKFAQPAFPIAIGNANLTEEQWIPMVDFIILATAPPHDAILWTQGRFFRCS